HLARNFSGRSFLFPLGFFPDPYYSDYSSAPAAEPRVIVVQAPIPTTTPQPIASTMQPVLIELEGDRYVRRNAEDTSEAIAVDQQPAIRHAGKPADMATHTPANPDLAPVVLIFRDGHREDVSAYTITDDTLYANGDYYANGSWNKKIELSSL